MNVQNAKFGTGHETVSQPMLSRMTQNAGIPFVAP